MSKTTNPVETFFMRYNFVVLVALGAVTLSLAIYLASSIYITSSDPNNAEIKTTIPNTFDKTTREKIDSLHESDDPDISVKRPDGRINPFSE